MRTDLVQIALATTGNDRFLLCFARELDQLILPGGSPEPGESDEETVARELREELGPNVRLKPGSLHFLGHFSGAAAGHTKRSVEIRLYGGAIEGEPKPSGEIREIVWFDINDKDRSLLSPVLNEVVVPFLLELSAGPVTSGARF